MTAAMYYKVMNNIFNIVIEYSTLYKCSPLSTFVKTFFCGIQQ